MAAVPSGPITPNPDGTFEYSIRTRPDNLLAYRQVLADPKFAGGLLYSFVVGVVTIIISLVTLALLLLKWKDLMVVFFDEGHARSVGLNPTRLKVLFFTLLSAAVAGSVTVGTQLPSDIV